MLWVFYRVVQSNWPDSYFALQDITSLEVSASLPRYATFRFLPVAFACLFVAVSVEQMSGRGVIAGTAVGTLHGLLTAGRGFARAVKTKRLNRTSLLLAHGVLFVLLVVTGLLTGLASRTEAAKSLIPDVSQVTSDLWTALLAGVLGAFLIKVTSGRELSEGALIERLRARLPDDLREYARRKAEETDSDPDLVEAFMIVENVQRPRWLRRFERLKGTVVRSGTYGILQVHSDDAAH